MGHRTDQQPQQPTPAQTREVGETGSATVADTFCTAQNKVTMDPNRPKRIMYFAEPIAPAVSA